MSNKNKIRRLVVVVVIVLMAIILVLLLINKQRTSSPDARLFSFDTSRIKRIEVRSFGSDLPIVLEKDSIWLAGRGGIKGKASAQMVQSILTDIGKMESKTVLCRKVSQWEQYKISDSLARRITVFNDRNRKVADFYIGGLLFIQSQPEPNSGFPDTKAVTPVRKEGKKTVYAVEGYFSMTLNRGYSEYRDQLILHQDFRFFDKIYYHSPDRSYSFDKVENHWYMNGSKLDSLSITNYFRKFKNMRSVDFADDFVKTDIPAYRMEFYRSDSLLARISAWDLNVDSLILTSDMNRGTYFKMDREEWRNRLFPNPDTLVQVY